MNNDEPTTISRQEPDLQTHVAYLVNGQMIHTTVDFANKEVFQELGKSPAYVQIEASGQLLPIADVGVAVEFWSQEGRPSLETITRRAVKRGKL